MGEYVFRFPADTPKLTYERLVAVDRIGTTIDVEHDWTGGLRGLRNRAIRLYGVTIAVLYADRVRFPRHGDKHQATRIWIEKIVQDNDIGITVYRNRKGVLVIDGDDELPVEGREYAIGSKS